MAVEESSHVPDDLLGEARRGSPQALAELFTLVRSCLLLTHRSAVPPAIQSKVALSDLVQETLADGSRRFDSFTGRSAAEFIAWLRAILANKLTDSVRRHDTTQAGRVRREVSLFDLDPQATAALESSTGDPAGVVMRHEEARRLERAVKALPALQCEVLLRRHWEGESFGEIAAAMGRSEPAVRQLWCRGFKKLRQLLAAG